MAPYSRRTVVPHFFGLKRGERQAAAGHGKAFAEAAR